MIFYSELLYNFEAVVIERFDVFQICAPFCNYAFKNECVIICVKRSRFFGTIVEFFKKIVFGKETEEEKDRRHKVPEYKLTERRWHIR